jgi:hypothetical protein
MDKMKMFLKGIITGAFSVTLTLLLFAMGILYFADVLSPSTTGWDGFTHGVMGLTSFAIGVYVLAEIGKKINAKE